MAIKLNQIQLGERTDWAEYAL